MIQEDKELLLKDLCGRLPYGVKIKFRSNGFRWDYEQTLEEIRKCDDGEYAVNGWGIHGIKAYLRPMSSMTDSEQKEFVQFHCLNICLIIMDNRLTLSNESQMFDWLNRKMFDYRGLIEKGLALEAPEGMYIAKAAI